MSNLIERVNPYIGLPYVDGLQDCYGLVRRVYLEHFGMQLRNYARPVGFDHCGVDLIEDNFRREGFLVIEVPLTELEPGDGLLFRVASKLINHVGVLTQGDMFLHHLYQRASTHDFLDPRWKNRLAYVVRHPDVTEFNQRNREKLNLLDLIPPHLRMRFET